MWNRLEQKFNRNTYAGILNDTEMQEYDCYKRLRWTVERQDELFCFYFYPLFHVECLKHYQQLYKKTVNKTDDEFEEMLLKMDEL